MSNATTLTLGKQNGEEGRSAFTGRNSLESKSLCEGCPTSQVKGGKR